MAQDSYSQIKAKLISLTEIKNMKKQKMVLNGPLTLLPNIQASIPQRYIIRPMSFLIYINDFSLDL